MIQTWVGRPARFAYASDWGITVRPTVIPATRSPTASCALYLGNQESKGTRLYRTFFVKDFLAFSRIRFASSSQRLPVASSFITTETEIMLKAYSYGIMPNGHMYCVCETSYLYRRVNNTNLNYILIPSHILHWVLCRCT